MLPDDISVIDYNNLQLTRDEILQRIEKLKGLALADNSCSKLRMDDEYLLRFLHVADYHPDNALEKMQKCAKIIQNYPEQYTNLSAKSCEMVLKEEIRVPIEQYDLEGRRIWLLKLGNLNANKHTMTNLSDIDNIHAENNMSDPATVIHGLCLIIDCKNLSMSLLKLATLQNVKIFLNKLEVFPIKSFVAHVINQSSVVTLLFKLIFPFLSKELKKKISFHSNSEGLQKHISKKAIPVEYGGENEVNYQDSIEKLIAKNDEILEKLSYLQAVANNK